MFNFTKNVLISSLLFSSVLNAANKEVPKNEIAQMEQLELLKRKIQMANLLINMT